MTIPAPTILISEIFGPTIQGEGAQIGQPTVFVRTGGCDYRCVWCDTPYAVLPVHKEEWTAQTPEQIIDQVDALAGCPILITLSGGNPALQPLGLLLVLGHKRGHTFTLETQGTISRPWFYQLDALTLSPKPPSAGNVTTPATVRTCLNAYAHDRAALKLVVFDDADYAYAQEMAAAFPDVRLFLQVGTDRPPGPAVDPADALLERYHWLVEKVLADRWYRPTVLPQLHVLLWGHRRGV